MDSQHRNPCGIYTARIAVLAIQRRRRRHAAKFVLDDPRRNAQYIASYGENIQVKIQEFLSSHPVFTRHEFAAAVGAKKPVSEKTIDSHFLRYVRMGRIGRIKRSVYFTVPAGDSVATTPLDFPLIASRLTRDSILGYHTALEVHGYAQSFYERFFFLTRFQVKPLRFRKRVFVPQPPPAVLQRLRATDIFTTEIERRGLTCRVTSLERTVVDALDRPGLAGGLEEVWRSLSGIPVLDLEVILEYLKLRDRAVLAAKVGLFLETHRKQFSVPQRTLTILRRLRPRQPHYLDRLLGGKLVASWNLIAPSPFVSGEWGGL